MRIMRATWVLLGRGYASRTNLTSVRGYSIAIVHDYILWFAALKGVRVERLDVALSLIKPKLMRSSLNDYVGSFSPYWHLLGKRPA